MKCPNTRLSSFLLQVDKPTEGIVQTRITTVWAQGKKAGKDLVAKTKAVIRSPNTWAAIPSLWQQIGELGDYWVLLCSDKL